jgi:aspartate aminotransferase-like enzyme
MGYTGGIEIAMDAWGIDALYSGTQKCLSCPPGLAPLSFSEKAVAALENRKTKVPNWYLDLPMLNSVRVPDGVDEAAVRSTLLNQYKIEIGAGLGPLAGKIWRIGLMGHTARQENVSRLLAALKEIL